MTASLCKLFLPWKPEQKIIKGRHIGFTLVKMYFRWLQKETCPWNQALSNTGQKCQKKRFGFCFAESRNSWYNVGTADWPQRVWITFIYQPTDIWYMIWILHTFNTSRSLCQSLSYCYLTKLFPILVSLTSCKHILCLLRLDLVFCDFIWLIKPMNSNMILNWCKCVMDKR